MMVSYARARGEGLGVACPSVGLERPHRMLMLMFTLLAAAFVPEPHATSLMRCGHRRPSPSARPRRRRRACSSSTGMLIQAGAAEGRRRHAPARRLRRGALAATAGRADAPHALAVRVCIVTPYDLSHDGGVNRHARSLAAELRAAGPRGRGARPGERRRAGRLRGARRRGAGAARTARSRASGCSSRPRAPARCSRTGRFDVVHVHEPIVPGPGRHALRLAAARWSPRSTRAPRASCRVQRALRAVAAAGLSRIDVGIAVSRAAKRFARDLPRAHRGGPERRRPLALRVRAARAARRAAPPSRRSGRCACSSSGGSPSRARGSPSCSTRSRCSTGRGGRSRSTSRAAARRSLPRAARTASASASLAASGTRASPAVRARGRVLRAVARRRELRHGDRRGHGGGLPGRRERPARLRGGGARRGAPRAARRPGRARGRRCGAPRPTAELRARLVAARPGARRRALLDARRAARAPRVRRRPRARAGTPAPPSRAGAGALRRRGAGAHGLPSRALPADLAAAARDRARGARARALVPAARARARAVPRHRPVVYVGKHPRSWLYLETMLLGLAHVLGRGPPPVPADGEAGTALHRLPGVGWVRRHVGTIPATEAAALAALAAGESVLVFPGGARELYGPSGHRLLARPPGFARIAARGGRAGRAVRDRAAPTSSTRSRLPLGRGAEPVAPARCRSPSRSTSGSAPHPARRRPRTPPAIAAFAGGGRGDAGAPRRAAAARRSRWASDGGVTARPRRRRRSTTAHWLYRRAILPSRAPSPATTARRSRAAPPRRALHLRGAPRRGLPRPRPRARGVPRRLEGLPRGAGRARRCGSSAAESRIEKVLPGLPRLKARVGAITSEEDCVAVLERGEQLLVTPGGMREAQPRRDFYRLRWDGRYGFARLALRDRGAHRAARGRRRRGGVPGLPARAALVLAPLPLPARVHVALGEPIPVARAPERARELASCGRSTRSPATGRRRSTTRSSRGGGGSSAPRDASGSRATGTSRPRRRPAHARSRARSSRALARRASGDPERRRLRRAVRGRGTRRGGTPRGRRRDRRPRAGGTARPRRRQPRPGRGSRARSWTCPASAASSSRTATRSIRSTARRSGGSGDGISRRFGRPAVVAARPGSRRPPRARSRASGCRAVPPPLPRAGRAPRAARSACSATSTCPTSRRAIRT